MCATASVPIDSETLQSTLKAQLHPLGLTLLGGFELTAKDQFPPLSGDVPATSLVLIGNAGSQLWGPFNLKDYPTTNPLDRWTEESITPIAYNIGARALYPFVKSAGTYWPFQKWAMRAGIASPSPLGILIHPTYGLWFALRAALLLPISLGFPASSHAHPCETCVDKPCLSACPVNAFAEGSYAVPACRSYLREPPGNDCMTRSCRARRACPVGQDLTYEPDHAAFHMKAFV